MTGRKYLISIFLVLLSCVTVAKEVRFEQLGIEEGLSQIGVRSLWQDEIGCLWIGTNEGLIRYNGNGFDNVPLFSEGHQAYFQSVQAICGDGNGHLYLKTNFNDIFKYDVRKGESEQIYRGLNDRTLVMSYGKHCLWVAIQNNIGSIQENEWVAYGSLSDEELIITAIFESSDGCLYVGTETSGVYRFRQGRTEQVISAQSQVIALFEDSERRIWVGTQREGLFMVTVDGVVSRFVSGGETEYALSSNYVRAICEDDDGKIWIGTISGLDRLDPLSRQIEHCGRSSLKNYRLSHPAVLNLLKDRLGNIWVATFYGGINYFNPGTEIFDFYDFDRNNVTSEYPIVSSVAEDGEHNLWIGTEGMGLLCLDRDGQTTVRFRQGKNTLSRDIIKSLYCDTVAKTLWIGTHQGGLNKLDLKTDRFEYIPIGTNDNLSVQSIQVIIPYRHSLYLGTLAGVYRYDRRVGLVESLDALNERISIVQDMAFDRMGHLWIAGSGLYRYDLKTQSLYSYHHLLTLENGSPCMGINAVCPDSLGRVWLGTSGGGVLLFDPATNRFQEFNRQNSGLDNNYVSSLFISESGHVLAGTNSGFSFIDEKQHRCFNYKTRNGFPLLSMMSGSIVSMDDGRLALSGINGICLFDENYLIHQRKTTQIRFDKLWVNNRIVMPGDESGILNNILPFMERIELNHRQKMFTIDVASDSYTGRNQPDLLYRLEPYDQGWIGMEIGQPISYMNLPRGNYTLKVRQRSLYGPDSDEEIALDIVVKPPIYATWGAYVIYLFCFLSALLGVILFIRSKLLLQASLVFERKDKERRELDNQSKLRFFTYVSHEFRTPITLVVNQLEIVMRSIRKGSELYQEVFTAYRNARTLTYLVNELLDFRKQEHGALRLVVVRDDIARFVQEIYDSFVPYAQSKNVKFHFVGEKKPIELFFDATQLCKVFNNLIFNAFKYTKPEGNIEVEIEDYSDHVAVSVRDDGIGMSREIMSSIFNRFYQANNDQNDFIAGSGLGLALSKGIVELHSGSISVESQEGKGSKFTVILLKGVAHFKGNDRVTVQENDSIQGRQALEQDFPDLLSVSEGSPIAPEYPADAPTVLIVEDDPDLRVLLKRILASSYRVIEARQGAEGFELARVQQPDLIVSDVMMPEMNGNQMCRKLKNNFETCHIPIIFLTAQSTVEQNIEGLKSGADDFICKPFDARILLMRCGNLLNNRKILQEKFSRQIETNPQGIASNAADRQFIEKAVSLIRENIADRKINVDFLCSEMAIGRRLFFTKMKSITGQTPNDFILTVKYKVAASMMKEHPEMNISEISDVLGFSSEKYFGKGFKEHFGISPREMRKRFSGIDPAKE